MYSITLILIILIFIFFLLLKYRDRKEHGIEQIQGYKVEFIHEHMLRGKLNQFAVVYHEKGKAPIWYYGSKANDEYVLDISRQTNEDAELLKQRIMAEVNRKYRLYRNHLRINIID